VAAGHGSGDVVRALGQEGDGVAIQGLHLEARQVGTEGDLGVVAALLLLGRAGLDDGILGDGLVVAEGLDELEALLGIQALDDELGGEDVGELGAVSVAAAGRLLLVVVEVGSRQELAEDERWDVDLYCGGVVWLGGVE